jgi:hypothetical protein
MSSSPVIMTLLGNTIKGLLKSNDSVLLYWTFCEILSNLTENGCHLILHKLCKYVNMGMKKNCLCILTEPTLKHLPHIHNSPYWSMVGMVYLLCTTNFSHGPTTLFPGPSPDEKLWSLRIILFTDGMQCIKCCQWNNRIWVLVLVVETWRVKWTKAPSVPRLNVTSYNHLYQITLMDHHFKWGFSVFKEAMLTGESIINLSRQRRPLISELCASL